MMKQFSDTKGQIRRIRVSTNGLPVRHTSRMPREVIEASKAYRRSGNFEAAIAEIEARPPSEVAGDAGALNEVALSYFGAGDPRNALNVLDAAMAKVRFSEASIQINRANVLKSLGRYDDALDAALAARDTCPAFVLTHLAVISVYTDRDGSGDRESAKEAVLSMTCWCPEWMADPEVRRYLRQDGDFRIRRDAAAFRSIFGCTSEEMEERK